MKGDFAALVESEIFSNVGLRRSYIRLPEAQMARYAWGYDRANKAIRMTLRVLGAPTYGVKATAADMIRWVEANIRPTSLDAPARQAVEGTHVGYFRVGEMVQGLGWEQYPYPIALNRLLAGNSNSMIQEAKAAARLAPPQAPSQPTLFNKTGSTNGFGAYVAFVPEKRVGIVMLANKNLPIPARVTTAHAVLEHLSSHVQ